MEVIQLLVILLLIVMFIAGLVSIVRVLAGRNSPIQQIGKKTSDELEQIASEGKRVMDDLSEQYLNKIYSQVTHQRRDKPNHE